MHEASWTNPNAKLSKYFAYEFAKMNYSTYLQADPFHNNHKPSKPKQYKNKGLNVIFVNPQWNFFNKFWLCLQNVYI